MPIAPPIGSLTRLNSSVKELLGSFFQLNQTEIGILVLIMKSKVSLTIDDIAKKMKNDRTTVFRATQKLINEGLCYKENKSLAGQGYVQVYHSITKEEFKIEIEKRIKYVQEHLNRLLKKLEEDIDKMIDD